MYKYNLVSDIYVIGRYRRVGSDIFKSTQLDQPYFARDIFQLNSIILIAETRSACVRERESDEGRVEKIEEIQTTKNQVRKNKATKKKIITIKVIVKIAMM